MTANAIVLVANALSLLAFYAANRDDARSALRYIEQSLDLSRAISDRFDEGRTYTNLEATLTEKLRTGRLLRSAWRRSSGSHAGCAHCGFLACNDLIPLSCCFFSQNNLRCCMLVWRSANYSVLVFASYRRASPPPLLRCLCHVSETRTMHYYTGLIYQPTIY
jgi:hypothetical protein